LRLCASSTVRRPRWSLNRCLMILIRFVRHDNSRTTP
jgi:hypothetical protein